MNNISLTKNKIVKFLGKDPKMFTREDIIDFIEKNDIEMINFMYPAGDGRLKTLNFVINNRDYLETILISGERVDGSSLFSFIEAGNSDLYVMPRYSTAFVDPFAEIPTVTMLCSFFDKEGNALATSPEQTLRKACSAFRQATQWENWNITSSPLTPACSRPPTNAGTMNRHHMPNSMISAPNA